MPRLDLYVFQNVIELDIFYELIFEKALAGFLEKTLLVMIWLSVKFFWIFKDTFWMFHLVQSFWKDFQKFNLKIEVSLNN